MAKDILKFVIFVEFYYVVRLQLLNFQVVDVQQFLIK